MMERDREVLRVVANTEPGSVVPREMLEYGMEPLRVLLNGLGCPSTEQHDIIRGNVISAWARDYLEQESPNAA